MLGVLADYIGRFSTKSTIPVIVLDEDNARRVALGGRARPVAVGIVGGGVLSKKK